MSTPALHRTIDVISRRAWLLAAAACATLAAASVAALVEANYLGPRSRAPAVQSLPVAPTAPARNAPPDASTFVQRNMFCSACGPGPGPTDFFDPQAILIAINQSDEPRATLRVLATEAQGSWGRGEIVPGVGRIVRIGWSSIDVVDVRGRRATLSLIPAGRGGAGTAIPAPTAASEWADRITKIDDHTFEVDRSLVHDLLGAMRPGSLRILPVTDHGALVGLRIFGVKEGSLTAAFGVHNGDVLSAINGKQIESIQTLIDVYAQLDQLSHLELDGKRADKPLAISLRLR